MELLVAHQGGDHEPFRALASGGFSTAASCKACSVGTQLRAVWGAARRSVPIEYGNGPVGSG
eukprot:3001187-Pyramimonas_sp.AAC.1